MARTHRTLKSLVSIDKRRLEKAAPTLAMAIEFYAAEMAGEFGAADPVRLAAIADLEGLRRRLLKKINKKGLLLEQPVKDEDGNVVVGLRENPLIGSLIQIHRTLGYTAQDMVLSKKSRGETAKDLGSVALTRERIRRLRSSPPLGLPPIRGRVATAAEDVETETAESPTPEPPQPS